MATRKANNKTEAMKSETRQKNMRNLNNQQGKKLNFKTYEFVCDDCLNNALNNGAIYCLCDKMLNRPGICKCGKTSIHKARLI